MRRNDSMRSMRPTVAVRTSAKRMLGTPEAQALAVLAVCALILALLALPQGVHVVRVVGAVLLTLYVAYLALRPRRR
jgi:Ca2+/Na+ antiporter